MERKTILGLIGRGKWGQNYIKTIRELSSCELPESNIRTRDYPELFDKDDIDGVIIASPTDTHFEIARDLLIKNFNLLIEKPITKTYQQALDLQKLNKEHKVTVVAGHIQIYDPAYVELKKSLGKIGKIQKMIFKGLQSPVRQDSTVIENWGPHPIYLFIDIAGRNPITTSAKSTTDDNIHLDFDFGDNLQGSADIGCLSPNKERELTIVGDKGSLTLDWSGPIKKLYFKNENGKKKNIAFDTVHSPLELEVLEFIDCIKTGRQPKTPLSQGVEVMKIIELLK